MSSSIFRRFTAFMTALLLLQLTLAGSSAACALDVGKADTAAEHHGMSMAGSADAEAGSNHSAVASEAAPQHHDAALERGAPRPNESNCPAHGTSNPCQLMTTCAPVVLGTAMTATTVIATHATRAIPSRVLAPPTRTTAPELPPPRA